MIILALSVFFNALIFIFFKWLGKLKARSFPVVVWNYFFAGIVALFLSGVDQPAEILNKSWLPAVALLGAAFVFVFNLMAVTTREAGASKAVIANKISLIIPVLSAYYLYNDHFGFYKIAGLLFTLAGLFLMASGRGNNVTARAGWLVVILFAISGFMDASFKYIQHFWLNPEDGMLFTSLLFLFACLTGLISMPFMKTPGNKSMFWYEMRLGLMLGLINVGSIFFLVSSLQIPGLESSFVFPLNNIGVIVISAVTAVFLFGERLEKRNYLGLVISLLALFFLFLSNFND